ncbi:Hypothetical protein PENO1_030500 [Penicillium occitanis (nom. inval.)]|nr:Hypothetical protein PENO1_030500 [Penicillium occitanis (nom. inval.)]
MYEVNADSCIVPIYISSILHYTNKPTDNEAIAQARQKIQNEPLQLSKEPRMIGNKGGFDMFRELRAAIKKLDDLNAKVKSLEDVEELKELNGVNELISRSRFSDLYIDVRKARNQATHGANIKFHRKLLDLPSHDKGKRHACVEGFVSTYDFSPAVFDSHFREAPEKIIKLVNQRSDLYHLYAYTRSSHHQKEITEMKAMCNEIISVWISEKATTISVELDGKISAFNHLHKLWEEEEYRRR